MEAPCNKQIEIFIALGDPLTVYLSGDEPVIPLRRVSTIKYADTPEQMLMHIPRKALDYTAHIPRPNLKVSCGIDINYLKHLRFAIPHARFEDSGLHLRFEGVTPTPIKIRQRLYYGSIAFSVLPQDLTAVAVGKRVELTESGNEKTTSYFDWEGSLFAAPSSAPSCPYQNLSQQILDRLQEHSPDETHHIGLRVRYSTTLQLLQWNFVSEPFILAERIFSAEELPVSKQPMLISHITRTKYHNIGVTYEIDLSEQGRYRLPLMSGKEFWRQLTEVTEIITSDNQPEDGQPFDIMAHNFSLVHSKSEKFKPKYASREEEAIIISMNQVTIVKLEPAKKRKQKKQKTTDTQVGADGTAHG